MNGGIYDFTECNNRQPTNQIKKEIKSKKQKRLDYNNEIEILNEKIGEETFTVQTPLQALSSIQIILGIINLIVVGIAAISLLVGGIGIANTMYTSVLERTNEIGIMKAVGAQNRDILYIFLIESGLLGLVGGIVGALAGLGISLFISNIANQALGADLFRVAVSYPLLIGSVLFSFIVGIISGVFPARQASKLNVVEALRR